MQSICAVEGVSAGGIREGKYGLALIRASGAAAAVFTRNQVRAAPVELMMERMRRGRLEAIVANSGCANCYTGRRGYADAVRMCEIAGGVLGVDPEGVGVASTGVIGRYLDMPLLQDERTLKHFLERSPADLLSRPDEGDSLSSQLRRLPPVSQMWAKLLSTRSLRRRCKHLLRARRVRRRLFQNARRASADTFLHLRFPRCCG